MIIEPTPTDGSELERLTGLTFQGLERREHDWVLDFEGSSIIVISCLWRLLENDRLRWTSEDDGHQFGLPAPVDMVNEVGNRLNKSKIESITLEDKTLDLQLKFSNGCVFQILPNSAGYESWIAYLDDIQVIAAGNAKLHRYPIE